MKSKEEIFKESVKISFDPEIDLNKTFTIRELWNFEDFICYIRDNIFGNDIFYPPLLNFTIGQKNEEIILTFGEVLDEIPIAIFRSQCKITDERTDTVICASIRSELLRDDIDAWQIKKAGEIVSLIEEHPEAFNNFFDNF